MQVHYFNARNIKLLMQLLQINEIENKIPQNSSEGSGWLELA